MNETVFIKKIKHTNFTTVDNGFVKNEKLSWKAKGILLYLVSLPEDWVLNQNELKNHSTDGLSSLRAGLEELKANGYLRISQMKNEAGKFAGTKYEIDEFGLIIPDCEKPKCENLKSEKPKSENRKLLNTNNNKILNIQNTNTTNYSSSPLTDFCEGSEKSSSPSKVPSSPSAPKGASKKTNGFSKVDYEECINIIMQNKKSLTESGRQISSAEYPYTFFMGKLKRAFATYGVDKTKEGLKNSVRHKWLVEQGYSMTALFSDSVFPKCIANELDFVFTKKQKKYGPKMAYSVENNQNYEGEWNDN